MGLLDSMKEELNKQKDKESKKKEEREAKKIKAEFEKSPVGRAKSAHKSGQRYFQVTFDIENIGRNWLAIMGHSMDTKVKETGDSVGVILTDIEKEGWSLIQAGYVFRQTHQDSRDKFLASGQQVAITGQTVGIYLFKRK